MMQQQTYCVWLQGVVEGVWGDCGIANLSVIMMDSCLALRGAFADTCGLSFETAGAQHGGRGCASLRAALHLWLISSLCCLLCSGVCIRPSAFYTTWAARVVLAARCFIFGMPLGGWTGCSFGWVQHMRMLGGKLLHLQAGTMAAAEVLGLWEGGWPRLSGRCPVHATRVYSIGVFRAYFALVCRGFAVAVALALLAVFPCWCQAPSPLRRQSAPVRPTQVVDGCCRGRGVAACACSLQIRMYRTLWSEICLQHTWAMSAGSSSPCSPL